MNDATMTDSNTQLTAIALDAPCRRCGYNLRGLQETGLCPECGLPTKLSLRQGILQHSNPTWVHQLSIGARWTGIGWIGLFCIPLVVFLLGFASALDLWAIRPRLVHAVFGISLGIVVTILCVGGLQMARRVPHTGPFKSDRKRQLFIALSTLLAVSIAVQLFSFLFRISWRVLVRFEDILISAQVITLAVIEYLRMEIAAELCEQIPANFAAAEARIRGRIMWISLLILGAVALTENVLSSLGIGPNLSGSSGDPSLCLFSGTILMSGLVAYVSALLTGIFMLGLAIQLRTQAKVAAENWNDSEEPFAPTEGSTS